MCGHSSRSRPQSVARAVGAIGHLADAPVARGEPLLVGDGDAERGVADDAQAVPNVAHPIT